MQWFFKCAGLMLLFCACGLCGYLKSLSLKKKSRSLFCLTRSVETLADFIRADGGEVSSLIGRCFSHDTVFFENGKIRITVSSAEGEAARLLEELFSGFGKGDKSAEYERTRLYAELLKKQYLSADKKCKELCRLYNTLGILCGVFLCILFL